MAYFISPIGNEQQEDVNGKPLSGGTIATYIAGTTTPTFTYKTIQGPAGASQTNPVVLNTLGRPTEPIWLDGNLSYKFVCADSLGNIQWTIDNITGVNAKAATLTSQWNTYIGTVSFIDPDTFSVQGDQTNIFQVNRRVQVTVAGGVYTGKVTTSVYTNPNTLVDVLLDSGALDSGLSQVQYGVISPLNTSLPQIPNFVNSAMFQDDAVVARALGDSSQGFSMINGTIVTSLNLNALTIAIKTKAGTDPSASDPVLIHFRDQLATGGSYTILSLTAATSLVVSSGSTLGATNATLARFWVVGFNDAGTFRLGVVNLANSVPIGDDVIASSTAEGGAGTADNAGVFYTSVAVTNKPMRVIGYIENTQAVAGTYVTAPSKLSLVSGVYATNTNSALTLSPKQNTTSGTFIDFTGIPVSAKQVTLLFSGMSTNNTSNIIVQIGPGYTPETTSYLGDINYSTGATVTNTNTGTGVTLNTSVLAANVQHGKVVFDLVEAATNAWVFTAFLGGSNNNFASMTVGSKVLAGALGVVRLTTAGGVDLFDAGIASVSYQ